MSKFMKAALWLFGFFVLIFIVMLPPQIKQTLLTVESLPLAGKVIVIDPGHGGQDGGAVGADPEKTEEKTITLIVSNMLRTYLEQAGAIVYLTREGDVDLADEEMRGFSNRKSQDIRRRLQFIHEKEADFFISIHLNALPSKKWRGAQTFFYPKFNENKYLATVIQNEFILNMENTERTPLQLNHVYLLKYAKVPGALVELGFLSHDEERELLKQKKYQQQLAASIYKGVLRYVKQPDPELEE